MNITTKMIASRAYFSGARSLFGYILMLFAVFLMGCASTQPVRSANPTDPLESFNRSMFAFNEGVDQAVLKPVAQGYRAVTPQPVRQGVTNFFDNLEDMWSTINSALQLRPKNTLENAMRVAVNTVFGLGGVINIADEMGIERHSEDFGKTLGRWGMPSGPYIVMPILGPSTLRDATTIVFENKHDPVAQINHIPTRNATTVLRIVETRTNLLRLGDLLDDVALDKYSFTRDAFLQKRRAEIYRPGQDPDAPTEQKSDSSDQTEKK
jgi:phospholipid-binding lipoprotein MlaA